MENIMRVKIQSQLQLESIIYTWFSENENCIIELTDEDKKASIYFISCKLPNGLVSLSACAGGHVIGNYMNHNDGKEIMKFVKEHCKIIDFDNIKNLYVILNKDKNTETNIYKSVQNDNNEVKRNTPILVKTLVDALELFCRFLRNKECNKLIYTFKVFIPEYNRMHVLDYVIDKMEIYGNAVCVCSVTSFPGFEAPNDLDGYFRYYDDKENLISTTKFVAKNLLWTFRRCMTVSKEEIELYVYSNCELI